MIQLVSVMGAGLLVGTALSVIIPEGMETLNMAYRYLPTGYDHIADEFIDIRGSALNFLYS